tara:strand:+ start:223 stop:621 length:399 start_codon:yes stop_codon:yes gene_type:complete
VKSIPLIPVGSKIKVEKSKIEKMLPKKLLEELPQMINGEVIDYKMTDGMGIGYVLKTDNNIKIWIFNSELNEQTKKEYRINDSNKQTNQITKEILAKIYKVNYYMNGNNNIKTLANPFNMISWLTFTLKDIF